MRVDELGPRSWARPSAVELGRLPMTSVRRTGDEVLSLDGTWSFELLDEPDADVARWSGAVEVPGCWTMQGVGDRPQYTNVVMPFPGPPPRVPAANPTGVYERSVTVPAGWSGRRVVLRVGGAETVLYVWVDGVPVGMSTDSRLPADFDLTDLVTPGATFHLRLTVVRWGAATYLEDQDHWHHAGLHRSVSLWSTPAVHLEDLHVRAGAGGELWVRAVTGERSGGKGWTARVSVDGEVVGVGDVFWEHPTSWPVNVALFTGRGAVVETVVPGVRPWSAEEPNLYDLRVALVDPGGDEVDVVSQRIGFRTVAIEGADLLVNGRRVLFKGVNRHDHDPVRGKAVTPASIRRDIELMQAANLNAVRTSHYPSDSYLYDVCDELGMYVIDEANIETHAYLRSLTKSPEWHPALLPRITRMAVRDKNHPCVVLWSLGNESGSSPLHDAAAAWLRSYDGTRPVHYESGLTDDEMGGMSRLASWRRPRVDTDVVAPMYPSVEDLAAWVEAGPDRPLIMCEYIHAMNNSCGGLDDYWDLIRRSPGLQGGFVWDWADQALVGDQGTLMYGGDFGDSPHDGPFCLNGLVAADRTPHPSWYEARAVLQPVGIDGVAVTNRYDVLTLAHLTPSWSVDVDGVPVRAGTLDPLTIGPGETTSLPIDVTPPPLAPGEIAHLTIRFHHGDRLVAVGQTELARSRGRQPPPGWLGAPRTDAQLCLWRAPIDNEVFGSSGVAARWEAQGLRTAHERVALATTVDGDLVTHTVDVPWDDVARVGVRLALPPSVVEVEWLGRGPHESYCDRQVAAIVGRWRTRVDDWGTPYVHPQANGNRTGVRWLRFLDASGEVVLTIDDLDDLDVTVSRHTDEELADAAHLEDLPARDHAFVWIDAAHRGVGSGAVGPDTAERHRIRAGTHTWSYRLR